MKRPILQLYFVLLLVLVLAGCGTGLMPATTPTELPTEQPTESPISIPTAIPTMPPMAKSTDTPTVATLAPGPAPKVPPPEADLGETWRRPTDDKVMVYVPAGEFDMGAETESNYYNERPIHRVTLDAFWLDQTEVTNAQFQECVEAGACRAPMKWTSITRDSYYGNEKFGDYPVLHVMWYQAVVYCEWAGARLPTESEWEYAACGDDDRLYPWGNEVDGTQMNACDTHCDLIHAQKEINDGYEDTAPVGTYPKGATWNGALDMAGNAWEWTGDWFEYYYPAEPQVNPQGPFNGIYRVIRGGGWDTAIGHCRCAFRNWLDPKTPYDSVGFRCAVSAFAQDSD